MATAIVIYILLLVIFLIISSLILRHSIKFNYLSPHFKYIVGIFGLIAVSVIILSVFLLFKMDAGRGTSNTTVTTSNSSNLNF